VTDPPYGIHRWAFQVGTAPWIAHHMGQPHLKRLVSKPQPSALREPPRPRRSAPPVRDPLAGSHGAGGTRACVAHEMRNGPVVCDTRLSFSGGHSSVDRTPQGSTPPPDTPRGRPRAQHSPHPPPPAHRSAPRRSGSRIDGRIERDDGERSSSRDGAGSVEPHSSDAPRSGRSLMLVGASGTHCPDVADARTL
jgi:hypothetical protein